MLEFNCKVQVDFYFVTEMRAYSPHHFLFLSTDGTEEPVQHIYTQVTGCVIAKECYLPRSQLPFNP